MLVEREQRVGGKAVSNRREGYTFDVTGHWLHVRDARVSDLLAELFAEGDLVEVERLVSVYSHGVMLPYPFQANLHGLPLEVVHECLVGLLEVREAAARGELPTPRTFEDFAVARFGRGIARHFFVPYNTKLWGRHPNALTPAWVTRYIPVPDTAQIIAGALGLRQEGLGYNARFLYPREGGIDALPNALLTAVERSGHAQVRLGTRPDAIDVEGKRVKLGDGWQSYASLISTLPLPELVRLIPDAPAAVRDAAGSLQSVHWRYLEVATRTPSPMPYHWVYVPEEDIPFFRVGVFSNAVPSMAPPGCASLYVELTDRSSPPRLDDVLGALAQMGAITDPGDVAFTQVRDVPHAYVVFDDAYEAALAEISGWLERVGVRSCGRYGAWIYNSMQDCIVEGMEAAQWAEAR